jgi:hypothetical protein
MGPASPGSLAYAILCKRHNGFLSAFDTEAAKLFAHLRLIDSKQTPEELSSVASVTIDGVLFEKWLLKALCGAMATRMN